MNLAMELVANGMLQVFQPVLFVLAQCFLLVHMPIVFIDKGTTWHCNNDFLVRACLRDNVIQIVNGVGDYCKKVL